MARHSPIARRLVPPMAPAALMIVALLMLSAVAVGQTGPPRLLPPRWQHQAQAPQLLGRRNLASATLSVGEGTTTLPERLVWGLAVGAPLGLAALYVLQPDDEWIALPVYAGFSALGVMAVTHKREGARPARTVLGAGVGVALPLLVHRPSAESRLDDDLAAAIAALVLAPVGAAVFHTLPIF